MVVKKDTSSAHLHRLCGSVMFYSEVFPAGLGAGGVPGGGFTGPVAAQGGGKPVSIL